MPRYEVTASIGTIRAEVEATDEDAAIDAAVEEWLFDAGEIIGDSTFRVVEIEDEDV